MTARRLFFTRLIRQIENVDADVGNVFGVARAEAAAIMFRA